MTSRIAVVVLALACALPPPALAGMFDTSEPITAFRPLTHRDGTKAWQLTVAWNPKIEKALGLDLDAWLEQYLPGAMAQHHWCDAGWSIEGRSPTPVVAGYLVEGLCR